MSESQVHGDVGHPGRGPLHRVGRHVPYVRLRPGPRCRGVSAKGPRLYASPEESSFDAIPFADGRVFERYSQPQRLGGRVVGRVWSFRDITARVRAEQQRDQLLLDERRARTAAEEAVHLRDEFLSIASHELRTPLTSLQLAIQSLGQRLARGMDVERVRSAVALSGRQVKRLTDLVDMLLDVSRIQAGRLELYTGARRPARARRRGRRPARRSDRAVRQRARCARGAAGHRRVGPVPPRSRS